MLPFLITGLVIAAQPSPSLAASGGRIGGGSFRAPSMPRGGGYGGSYRGGYGGGGYRGGGMGFPFLLPIFGFGGGGLFGFLILMTIAGVIANAVRGGLSSTTSSTSELAERSQAPITMVQLQLGLLASAKELQEKLRQIALSASTDNAAGLQAVLQETTLALLRRPDLWVYSNFETGKVPFNSAEATFNRLSISERSKLKAELTTNFSGKQITKLESELQPGDPDEANEYIVVTVLLATRNYLTSVESSDTEQLKQSIRAIGSVSSNDLIALEVIWQPEGKGEVLTAEELVTSYPNLKHL